MTTNVQHSSGSPVEEFWSGDTSPRVPDRTHLDSQRSRHRPDRKPDFSSSPIDQPQTPTTPTSRTPRKSKPGGSSSGRSRHKQKQSNEVDFRSHVTRDSMVVDLLSSFNQLPGAFPADSEPPSHPPPFVGTPQMDDSPPISPKTVASPQFQDFSSSATPAQIIDLAHDLRPAKPFNPYQSRNLSSSSHGDKTSTPPRLESSLPTPSLPIDAAESPQPQRSRPSTAVTPTKDKGEKKKKKKKSRTSNNSVDEAESPVVDKPMSSSHQRNRSSSSFDLNPKDKARRRSRTNPAPAPTASSILNRSRPIPSEYHDFDVLRAAKGVHAVRVLDNSKRPNPRPALPSRTSSALSAQETEKRAPSAEPSKLETTPRSERVLAERSGNTPLAQTSSTPSPAARLPSDKLQNVTESRNTVRPQPSADTRHGFFKRVFGSTKNQASPTLELSSFQLPPIDSLAEPGPVRTPPLATASSTGILRQDSPSSAAAALPSPPAVPPDQPHVIHKKSSFFRRKKRAASISTGTKEVIGDSSTPASHVAGSQDKSDSASISSLRQVMTPFLHTKHPAAVPSPVESTYYDSKERQSVETTDPSLHTPHAIRSASHPPSSFDEKAVTKATQNLQSDQTRGSEASSNAINSKPGSRLNESLTQARSPTPTSEKSAEAFLEYGPMIQRHSVSKPGSKSGSMSEQIIVTSPKPTTPNTKNTSSPTTIRVIPDGSDSESKSAIKLSKPTPESDINAGHRVLLHSSRSEQTLHTTKSRRRVNSSSSNVIQSLPTASIYTDISAERDVPSRSTSVTADSASEITAPSQDAQSRARDLFEGHGDPIRQKKAALILGQPGAAPLRMRQAYMALYDFSGLNILLAMRDLCGRLTLKGETQQVDRILSAFAERWCECNPNHGFRSLDNVYTLCYSILLLNTDLHLANLDQKMTRSQFIRNTMETLQSGNGKTRQSSERNGSLRADASWKDTRSPSPASMRRPSVDTRQVESRQSGRSGIYANSDANSLVSPSPYEGRSVENSDLLMHSPFELSQRTWETHLETLLKEFYNSIRNQRLPLSGVSDGQTPDTLSSSSLAVDNIRRPGILTKMPSEGNRWGSDLRSLGNSWNFRNRSRPRLYQSGLPDSSRTSVDDTSAFSPNASSTWSRSLGKTATSMSSESLASRFTQTDFGFHQSIGFAGALSHAIIREEDGAANGEEESGATGLLEDESLELEGAPWAKEGMLHHKHHMESADKKAKDRAWNQCFAVVEKGQMRLFSFNSKASMRSQKSKAVKGAVVGGGNWMDSAEALDTFTLRQTLANSLPPPGYSRSRPHVFALVLPTGAVHLFHVGTAEIAEEFVSTANYWSARLSKEPLVGGVSNIEYGWSDNVINTALLTSNIDNAPPSSAAAANRLAPHSPGVALSMASPRPSTQGSIRRGSSSIDLPSRARLPADKAVLSEWQPPYQSLSRSELKEQDQLKALQSYVKDVEEELRQHNELRAGLVLAYTPRHPNATKAMANWERKSSYLLKEIVKFRTYIDTLTAASNSRTKIYKDRADRLTSTENAES